MSFFTLFFFLRSGLLDWAVLEVWDHWKWHLDRHYGEGRRDVAVIPKEGAAGWITKTMRPRIPHHTHHTYLEHLTTPCLIWQTLILSIPDSVPDSSDTTGVPATPPKRSAPVTNRFNPTLGWLTFMQSLTRRAAESHFVYLTVVLPCGAGLKTICWCKMLQSVVTLNSASFNRDWCQVASEMPGRLPQQCRERYRHADIFVQAISNAKQDHGKTSYHQSKSLLKTKL